MKSYKKINFVDSNYDNNISEVILKTRNKEYRGYAKMADEDEPHESCIRGCRIAECRAAIKAFKDDLRIIKIEYNAINEIVQNCLQTKAFDPESPSAKVLFRQLNVVKKKKEWGEKVVEQLEAIIKEASEFEFDDKKED